MEKTIIYLTVFLKDGGQKSVGVPVSFIGPLVASIEKHGYEVMHLSSQESIEVIGFLFGSKEFLSERRIIMVGTDNASTIH